MIRWNRRLVNHIDKHGITGARPPISWRGLIDEQAIRNRFWNFAAASLPFRIFSGLAGLVTVNLDKYCNNTPTLARAGRLRSFFVYLMQCFDAPSLLFGSTTYFFIDKIPVSHRVSFYTVSIILEATRHWSLLYRISFSCPPRRNKREPDVQRES